MGSQQFRQAARSVNRQGLRVYVTTSPRTAGRLKADRGRGDGGKAGLLIAADPSHYDSPKLADYRARHGR